MAVAESGSTSCASIVSSDVLAAELDSEESSFGEEDQGTTEARGTMTTSEANI